MRDQVRNSYKISPVDMVSETIGGVSPVAHPAPLRTIIDEALSAYDVVWAAAGHPHAVYPTTFKELLHITGAQPMVVGD